MRKTFLLTVLLLLVAVAAPAAQDAFTEPHSGIAFVRVPGGSFIMGDIYRTGFESERPAFRGDIADFYLGRFEVTFEQYDRFCEATGRQKPADEGWGRGTRPVINVSWDDAQAYAEWLSRETGKCADCGSSWDGLSTAPVGSFKPTPFGLFDMNGNVYEWCEDKHHDSYAGAPTDGSARTEGKSPDRILRGGSFRLKAFEIRNRTRAWDKQDATGIDYGFRLVLQP